MTIKEFVEDIAYATLHIIIKDGNIESPQILNVDHYEEDEDNMYFYGDGDDEPLKLGKAGLIISFEHGTYNLMYVGFTTKISIKILE